MEEALDHRVKDKLTGRVIPFAERVVLASIVIILEAGHPTKILMEAEDVNGTLHVIGGPACCTCIWQTRITIPTVTFAMDHSTLQATRLLTDFGSEAPTRIKLLKELSAPVEAHEPC